MRRNTADLKERATVSRDGFSVEKIQPTLDRSRGGLNDYLHTTSRRKYPLTQTPALKSRRFLDT